MKSIQTLSNSELFETLTQLTGKEREVTAKIVEYLHEVDRRKLYLEFGYSSLYLFCTKGLGYSEGSAYRRMHAARCLDSNPEILEKLSNGSLSLCAVSELAKVSTDKRAKLIEVSSGKSKFEVQKLVAGEVPLKAPRPEKISVTATTSPLFSAQTEKPTLERRYTITLELTEAEYELLTTVQTLTSERVRSRAIVKALKTYKKLRSPVERQKRREWRKERSAQRTTTNRTEVTRNIPVAIRDKVYIRDAHQCMYVGKDGHRCSETKGLQIDHIKPFSIGGGHEPTNLRVLCGAHNRFVYDKFKDLQIQSGTEAAPWCD